MRRYGEWSGNLRGTPEDPLDYSCPHCGCRTDFHCETCERRITRPFRDLAAANRRIAQLTRERDEWENECKVQIRQAEAERDGIRAQAIQDTKDAAVKALEDEGRVSPILLDTMMYQHAADIIRNRI